MFPKSQRTFMHGLDTYKYTKFFHYSTAFENGLSDFHSLRVTEFKLGFQKQKAKIIRPAKWLFIPLSASSTFLDPLHQVDVDVFLYLLPNACYMKCSCAIFAICSLLLHNLVILKHNKKQSMEDSRGSVLYISVRLMWMWSLYCVIF